MSGRFLKCHTMSGLGTVVVGLRGQSDNRANTMAVCFLVTMAALCGQRYLYGSDTLRFGCCCCDAYFVVYCSKQFKSHDKLIPHFDVLAAWLLLRLIRRTYTLLLDKNWRMVFSTVLACTCKAASLPYTSGLACGDTDSACIFRALRCCLHTPGMTRKKHFERTIFCYHIN